ncbi:MAG TPA: glutathione S-transferase N-terminal domain-containing protein [Candidatus Binataceae bacterium]|nr:glutathione S-transferase N-terminal domain-containing protein [Candidatus Binataceae bacterium]
MMKLCYFPGACSLASHMVLEEAGAQFELMLIDFTKSEQRTPDYLKINPNGRVPALILDDGRAIFENIGIMTYVARTVPGGAKLIPSDPFEAARCYSLASFFASSVHVAWAHNARPERYTADAAAHPAMRETARKSFWNYLQMIDGWLAGREWLLSEFSVCDPYALVFYSWGMRGELPVRDLANYTAHKDRLLKRPAVRKALDREGNVLVKA